MKGERDAGRSRWDNSSDRDVEGGDKIIHSPVLRPLPSSAGRSRWGRSVLWAVLAVVLIECAFIVRLDILNTPLTLAYSHLVSHSTDLLAAQTHDLPGQVEIKLDSSSEILDLPVEEKNDTAITSGEEKGESTVKPHEKGKNTGRNHEKKDVAIVTEVTDNGICSEEWLEQADKISFSRNFTKQPVQVITNPAESKVWDKCSVPCVFKSSSDGVADAEFGLRDFSSAAQVLRSMESSAYFPENDIDRARKSGVTVVMTTSLLSDVPVGYFSWAEYPLMDSPKVKTKTSLAAAFISNCGGYNGRLTIMSMLQKEGIKVDSYGLCDQNAPGGRGLDKVEALREYKFSLAFENSNVEDYVTEKFFQALVAGSVPIVVGAPNIAEFAPGPNSLIHIKDISEVKDVVAQMKYLANNETAYNETLRWKFDGPSDSFLALVDMAAVHSSCRLCIFLATKLHMQEEATVLNRPCKCTSNSGSILHHIYVRERGRFEMESIFIKDADLTISNLEQAVLDKFTSLEHVPIWKEERPEPIRGDSKLRIYKIYPLGLTQREALYSWSFDGDKGLRERVLKDPCLELEVIFV